MAGEAAAGQSCRPRAKLKLNAPGAIKTSVEDLARDLGLRLGDQNELTIRAHQARQDLFIRSRQRLAGPRCPYHPPAARDGDAAGLSPGALLHRSEHAFAGGRPRCRRPIAIPLPRRLGKGPRAAQGASSGQAGGRAAEDPAQGLGVPVRRRADPRIRTVGGDRADRAHRDPARQRILRAASTAPAAPPRC